MIASLMLQSDGERLSFNWGYVNDKAAWAILSPPLLEVDDIVSLVTRSTLLSRILLCEYI